MAGLMDNLLLGVVDCLVAIRRRFLCPHFSGPYDKGVLHRHINCAGSFDLLLDVRIWRHGYLPAAFWGR